MDKNKKVLLALIAVALGVLFFAWYFVLSGVYHPKNNIDTGEGQASSSFAVYEADKRLLLRAPKVNADMPTEADNQSTIDYFTSLKLLAEETETITIGTGCQMTPLASSVKSASSLTIANNDTVPHTLTFDQQNAITVQPDSTRVINVQGHFGEGEGVWYYQCSDVSETENVGVLLVTVSE